MSLDYFFKHNLNEIVTKVRTKRLNTDNPQGSAAGGPGRSRGLWVRSAGAGGHPGHSLPTRGPSGAECPCSPGLGSLQGWRLAPQSSRGSGLLVTTSLPFRHTPCGPGPACTTGWTSGSPQSALTCHSQTGRLLHRAPPHQLPLHSDHRKMTRREETHRPQKHQPGVPGLDLACSETCAVCRSWWYCWS